MKLFHERGGFSLRHVTAFGTDEYVGLPPEDHRGSTRFLLNFYLFRQVDIPREQTFVPRGDARDLEAECKAWDPLIEARGGLDLVVCSASATTATSASTSPAARPRAACAWSS